MARIQPEYALEAFGPCAEHAASPPVGLPGPARPPVRGWPAEPHAAVRTDRRPHATLQPFFSDVAVRVYVDTELKHKVAEKMQETVDRGAEIRAMAELFSDGATDDFVGGVIAGRLYNSFYYQCRRIKDRNPERAETQEFLAMVSAEWDRMVAACQKPSRN